MHVGEGDRAGVRRDGRQTGVVVAGTGVGVAPPRRVPAVAEGGDGRSETACCTVPAVAVAGVAIGAVAVDVAVGVLVAVAVPTDGD